MKYKILVFGIFVMVLICFVLSFILVWGHEDVIVKWEIDNTYVDSNFKNWIRIEIYDNISFCIPNEWGIHKTSGIYSITDENGQLWASGALFRTEDDWFNSVRDFVSISTSLPISSMEIDPYSSIHAMKGADIDKLCIYADSTYIEFFLVQLTDASGAEFLLLLECNIESSNHDFDIAEAIMYSFAWKKN